MDLSLTSMDDMVAEIKNRFDTLVIITRKQLDKETDDLHYHFKDKVGCVGLMKIAENSIVNEYTKNEIGTFD